MKEKTLYKKGFTLIELSIVMVIIGLIIGAVLVGKDLIYAATVRAQISQIESHNSAVNTFRVKYNNYIPGDLPASQASSLGFITRSGAANHGDGNGFITDCSGSDGGLSDIGCEQTLFWADLSSANLIKGNFNTATDGLLTSTLAQLSNYFPSTPIGNNGYVSPCYRQSVKKNRFVILGWSGVTGGNADGGSYVRPLSPFDAFQIDSKIDDGLPLTGKFQASPTTPTPKASGVCITDETNSPYNISTPSYATVPSCNLWIFW